MEKVFKIRPLRKIFIVSLIIAIALPAAVTLYIYPLFTAQLIANTEDEAIRAAKHFMLMTIPDQNELSTAFLTDELLKTIQKITADFELMKLKIFLKSGETIYSTSSKDIGTINKNSYFHEIVAQGKAYTKVVKKNTTSLEGQTVTADVVETYVPIMRNNSFVGAFEIYYDITARTDSLNQLLSTSTIALVVLATTLMLAIIITLIPAANSIIERAQAEQALRKSEEQYRLLVMNLPSLVYKGYKDWSGEFFDNKVELLLGYSADEFNSKRMKWIDIIVAEDTETARKSISQALKTGTSYLREYRVKSKAGNIHWIQDRGQIIFDNKGEIEYFSGVFFDISERKQAEKEKKELQARLHYAQKMESIGTLAGGIAHNFNNLLMGIIGYTSLVLDETDADHDNYTSLKSIEELVDSGAKLTRQLLGYAREGKYEIKPLNLNLLVKETSDAFGAASKEIVVRQELAENLYQIKADKGQIEQTLLNLYVNAADAMPKGGHLFLKTMNGTHKDINDKSCDPKPGNYIILTVQDEGTGIDQETMERIFEPFFTTKGLAEGTGLGLASAYGIINNHGGYINVDSEKNIGTTFSIYFPAVEEKLETPQEMKFAGKIKDDKKTILLVDDEDIIIDVGQQMLKKLGYSVLSSKHGQEGVEIYRENKDNIAMVLLDMVMPAMGGGETYDKLKAINPKIKVLLSSGFSVDGQATEILNRGCNGFIQKPFNLQDLSQKIRETLDT